MSEVRSSGVAVCQVRGCLHDAVLNEYVGFDPARRPDLLEVFEVSEDPRVRVCQGHLSQIKRGHDPIPVPVRPVKQGRPDGQAQTR